MLWIHHVHGTPIRRWLNQCYVQIGRNFCHFKIGKEFFRVQSVLGVGSVDVFNELFEICLRLLSVCVFHLSLDACARLCVRRTELCSLFPIALVYGSVIPAHHIQHRDRQCVVLCHIRGVRTEHIKDIQNIQRVAGFVVQFLGERLIDQGKQIISEFWRVACPHSVFVHRDRIIVFLCKDTDSKPFH